MGQFQGVMVMVSALPPPQIMIFLIFVLFWGHIFDQIRHKNVDFEGVLKRNKKTKDISSFPGGMIFFVVEPPPPNNIVW